jgi:uncharacterized protein YcnI
VRTFKNQLGLVVVMISAMTLLLSSSVLAHVVVKPAEVLTGAFQTFTMGVPNEKDNSVTTLKLVLPSGLKFVSPTVKPGWVISVEKNGEGETATVTSITWSGGSIPAEQRDDFTFSAQAPDSQTELKWKAYQTYEDGTTTAWDQDPSTIKGDDDTAPTGPFSVTKVLKTVSPVPAKTNPDYLGTFLGATALVIALITLTLATRKPAPMKK